MRQTCPTQLLHLLPYLFLKFVQGFLVLLLLGSGGLHPNRTIVLHQLLHGGLPVRVRLRSSTLLPTMQVFQVAGHPAF